MRSKREDLIVSGEDKTKLMKVMTKKAGGVRIGQVLLEEVESFQYVGSVIDKTDGADDEDVT